MTDKDIVERTEYDWRAIAPESWDHDYRELWVTFAYTNDRLARWRRDYKDACAENDRLRATNAELVVSLTECADDLAVAIEAALPSQWRRTPDNARKYERDMDPVNRARALLDRAARSTQEG